MDGEDDAMRRPRAGWPVLGAVLAVVTLGVAFLPRADLHLRPLVGGSDCGRFTEPDVDLGAVPDPYYDPEQGETVDTLSFVDQRSLDDLVVQVRTARQVQVKAAEFSYQRANDASTSDQARAYQATLSFNSALSLTAAAAFAAQYGLRTTRVVHAYLGLSHLFVGEIPAVDPNGVIRTLEDIAGEYYANVVLQRAEVGGLTGRGGDLDPGGAAEAILTDVESRLAAAEQDGLELIGIVVEATLQQISTVVQTAQDVIVGVTPPGCDPQNAIVPDAWVPMIAHQLTDLPERNDTPISVSSPVADGR